MHCLSGTLTVALVDEIENLLVLDDAARRLSSVPVMRQARGLENNLQFIILLQSSVARGDC